MASGKEAAIVTERMSGQTAGIDFSLIEALFFRLSRFHIRCRCDPGRVRLWPCASSCAAFCQSQTRTDGGGTSGNPAHHKAEPCPRLETIDGFRPYHASDRPEGQTPARTLSDTKGPRTGAETGWAASAAHRACTGTFGHGGPRKGRNVFEGDGGLTILRFKRPPY